MMPDKALELLRKACSENLTREEVLTLWEEFRLRYEELFPKAMEMKDCLIRAIASGIREVDEDLFLISYEHDSIRELAYRVVDMMYPELEDIARELIALNLERTPLGSYIMRKLGGRGGGT